MKLPRMEYCQFHSLFRKPFNAQATEVMRVAISNFISADFDILAEIKDTLSIFFLITYATIRLSQTLSNYNYVQNESGSSHRAKNVLKLTFTSKVELIKLILFIVKS